MKTVSRAAIGLALAMGVAVPLAVSPAMAAKEKKEKPAPAKAWQLSKEFRAAYVPADAAVKANAPDAVAKIEAAEAFVKNGDEKYIAGTLRLTLGQATKNAKLQLDGIIAMIASGSAAAVDAPKLNMAAGQLAYQAGNYTDAKKFLAEAIRLGNPGVDANLLLAEANFKLGTTLEGLTALDGAVKAEQAAGRKAPAEWYGRAAAMAYKAKMTAETAKWTREQVRAYPTPENWRSALVIYRDSANLDNQTLIDLFRLMHDTKALAGERDFFEYASLAITGALPGEAKTVIEEGFASGAVSKSSRAVAERLTDANAKIPSDKASVVSDEKRAPAAADGRLAANTGSAYLAYGDYAKAINLFGLAQKKGGIDADVVNTRLGIALARAGQKDAARAAFQAVTGAARKEVAQFWLLWLDQTPAA
jgi:tetratricopeptide (TPR) repeat protein